MIVGGLSIAAGAQIGYPPVSTPMILGGFVAVLAGGVIVIIEDSGILEDLWGAVQDDASHFLEESDCQRFDESLLEIAPRGLEGQGAVDEGNEN